MLWSEMQQGFVNSQIQVINGPKKMAKRQFDTGTMHPGLPAGHVRRVEDEGRPS